jgi:anti-sigma factor ChrR (cupin superfamily)
MLNQNFHEKVVLKSSQLTPVSSPCDGVERTLLERNENSEYAISTTIVEFKPNSFFNEHVHDSGEELLVLEGTFSDEFGDYPAGTYIRNPHNTKHSPFSKNGCRLLVKLRQFNPMDNKQVIISTALVKWDSNTEFSFHQHHGGEEIFVLKGTFYDEFGKYPEQTWIRSPHMSKHKPFTLSDGALIFVKTGHLLNKIK